METAVGPAPGVPGPQVPLDPSLLHHSGPEHDALGGLVLRRAGAPYPLEPQLVEAEPEQEFDEFATEPLPPQVRSRGETGLCAVGALVHGQARGADKLLLPRDSEYAVDVRTEPSTLAAWLGEWLVGKPDLAAGTRASYAGHIRTYLVPHLGQLRLDKLQARHVEAMFASIEETNARILECRESDDPQVRASVRGRRVISLSTKHRIRATLRSALSEAVCRPDVPVSVNIASHMRLPSCPRKRPLVWTPDRVRQWAKDGTVPGEVMVWTPEQTRTFLVHARKYPWLYPMFHLIAVKGLRRGEAVGLPWSNTRLTDGQIDIRVQVVQLAWETITSTPKSAAGQRTITLDADTIKVLRAWKRFQNEARLKAGAAWTDTGLAFTRQDGSGWHPGQVSDWFLRIARAAGLPPITLHGLRHGAASLALAAGTDVKIVSAELGHATTHFTQDTYQSVFPDVAKAAAEATAALLRGPTPVTAG